VVKFLGCNFLDSLRLSKTDLSSSLFTPEVLFIVVSLSGVFDLSTLAGYKLFRRDRNCYGGGIMALVNTDFPSSRKGNLESENMENISFEVNINDKKWLIMGIYKAPLMSDNDFSTVYHIKVQIT
jgi:hypothetical protein